MGKSKNGGTRAFVRGRIGSDVYSIGKDGAGKKQQVIRSLAETVANPQTAAQMRGRMIMSTVMQAVSAMAGIIDHSFDGVAVGQPSISTFIAENYNLVKADVAAHPASGNVFGLNLYKEKGVKQGAYVISNGKAAGLAGVVVDASAKTLTIAVASSKTIADLKAALGITANDYFTVCAISATAGFEYVRVDIDASLADTTVISGSNIADVFKFNGNVSITPSLSGDNVVLTLSDLSANYGIIVSRKTIDGFKHNRVQLAAPSSPLYTADVALPTYPIGSERFLNGGSDAAPMAVVTPSTPTPEPESPSTVAAPTISGTTPFETSTSVTITAESGAEIHYTTDGNNPTSASPVYSSAITLEATATVKAIAIKDGETSSVASKTFTKGSGGGDEDPEGDMN